MRTVTFLAAATLALAAAAAAPALADAGLSLTGGPSFLTTGDARNVGGTVQTNVALGYDLGPKTIVPIRATLDFDYAGGSANGGTLNDYGAGIGARLTTPAYLGASVLIYNSNLHPGNPGTPGAGGAGLSTTSTSTTGVGTNLYAGEKLLGIPGGGGVGIQFTWRRVPSTGGYDPSSFTLGLRLSL